LRGRPEWSVSDQEPMPMSTRQGDYEETASPIKVLLADDHTMFREGLAAILVSRGGVEVVGQSINDERAAAMARAKKPDAVIMQVESPLEKATEAVSEMLALSPPPRVVICTMTEDPRYLREMLRLGISAYVHKSSSSTELIDLIRAAVLGPENGNVVVAMPRSALEESEDGARDLLTGREMEILLLAARGLRNRMIASSLHLSEKTVKRHLANVYTKIGVHSRVQATQVALREGWLTIKEVAADADGVAS
jgi:DNA-binding NarL/FixJ family response regulator